ncbi:MAG: glycoside hydrolase family 31 protein [Polyangiaceae bacterium]
MTRSPFLFATLLASLVLPACDGEETASTTGTTTTTSTGGAGGTGGGGPCDPPGAGDPVPDPAPHTPRWAFEPWISKDISDGPDTYAFVQGFEDRDIPVGAVVLDSPWETNYNTFTPNPTRYPEFPKLVSDMHDRGVRVVLWITQFVNSTSYDLEEGGDSYTNPSPRFDEGYECGFYVNDGDEYNWWKGKGASLDFLNPKAAAWWHAQQDQVLDAGIDGWKLDFGDSYVKSDTVKTAQGEIPHQEYAESYYRDFLAYGSLKRGKDFTTMVRAWDSSYGFVGRFHARPEHAPVCWMGDNRRDWVGIADVLDSMFRSAKGGYVVLGSDIGGYLDHDDLDLLGPEIPLDATNFMKWTALGGLSPFMQLHGRANVTPWTFPEKPDEVVAVYRYWSKLHSELVPFFFSLSEEAYAGAPVIVRPVGEEKDWPGDYRFALGDAFLVAPLLDGTGVRDVPLPTGTKYYDWWSPDTDPLDGGQTLTAYDATASERIPLFVRQGAIIPLEVSDEVTGLGTAASKGALTVLVYPDSQSTTFPLHDTDGQLTSIEAAAGAGGFTVKLSRGPRDTLVRVRVESAPASITVDGAAATKHPDRATFDAQKNGWFHEPATRSVWVRVPTGAGAHTVTAQ